MAARLALEAMQIEKTARIAAHEVWGRIDPTLTDSPALRLKRSNPDWSTAMNNFGFPVSPAMRLVDLSTALARQGLCLYWDVARRAVVVMAATPS